ncbi:MAG TPA: amidohydrolase [Firmicutes bacterium]|nr:amidohydrolase [Bacillota bacterium]
MKKLIIDAHCHLFTNDAALGFVSGSTFDEFVQELDGCGVEKFILFTIGGLFRDFQKSNDEIRNMYQKFPERIIPFGTTNPWYGEEALAEIDRCVNVLGMKGFKLHPWMMGFAINSVQMLPVMERISDYGMPVLVHSGTVPWSEPLQIAYLASQFPKVQFILAHMGITDLWKEAIDAARRYSNIWLETAGTPTVAIKTALQEIGPERIIFGSDSPYGGVGGCQFQMNKLKYLKLGKHAEALLLGENLRRILNI